MFNLKEGIKKNQAWYQKRLYVQLNQTESYLRVSDLVAPRHLPHAVLDLRVILVLREAAVNRVRCSRLVPRGTC